MSDSTPAAPVLSYQSTLGAPARAYRFDGATSIAQAAVDDFPTTALTLAMWVRTTQTDANAVLFSYDARNGDATRRLKVAGPAALTVSFGGSTASGTQVSVADGHWHHLAIQLQPADPTHYALRIYVDGMLAYLSLGVLAFTAGQGLRAGGPLVLGAGAGAGEIGYQGDMSELEAWSQVLTAPQVATVMQRRATTGDPGVVLAWPLDAAPTGSGITVTGGSTVDSTLRFRTGSAQAAWTVAANTTYDLRVLASDGGCWSYGAQGLTTSPQPIPGIPVNQAYEGRIRATSGGNTGPWSGAGTLVPLDLQGVTMRMNAADTLAVSLVAAWDAVDQAQSYAVALYQGAATTPTATSQQTTLTYDLTSRLSGTDSWRITAQGVAGGALGPPNDVVSLGTPNVHAYYIAAGGGVAAHLELSWSAMPGATTYFIQVWRQGTQAPAYQKMVAAPATRFSIPSTALPVQEGDHLTVGFRGIGPGEIGAASTQQITAVNLGVPVPAWQYTAAGDTLVSTWPAVTSATGYWVELFQGDSTTPVASGNQTGTAYPFTDRLGTADAFKLEVQATSSDAMGPPNVPVPPGALNPVFRYTQDTGVLQLAWTAQPNAYLRLYHGSPATLSATQWFDQTVSSYTVPPPNGGFVAGTVYRADLRGLGSAVLGAVTASSVTIRQLSKPVPRMVYGAGPPRSLTVQWDPVTVPAPTAGVTYQVRLTLGTVVQNPLAPQSATSYDLTSHLENAALVKVEIRALADGTVGPWSAVLAAPVPALAFSFDRERAAAQQLLATWTAAPQVYVEVLQGSTALMQNVYDASTAQYAVASPQTSASYTAKAKGIAAGQLGAMETANVTVHLIDAPTVILTQGTGAQDLKASWGAVTGAASYFTAKAQGGGAPVLTPVAPPALTADFPGLLAQTGAWTIRARGYADGSYGSWSNAGSAAAPTAATLAWDEASGTMSVGWTLPSTPANVYAEVRKVSDGSLVGSTWLAGSQTSWSFAFAAAADTQYRANVRTINGGSLSVFASATLTARHVVGPTLSPLTQDVSARSITASWRFDGSVTDYEAQLWLNDGAAPAVTQTPTGTTATFTSLTSGTTYKVRVRARSGGSSGLWSGWQSLVLGSTLSAPGGLVLVSNTNGDLTACWNAVTAAGVGTITYAYVLSGPDISNYTGTTTNTRVDLPRSATHVSVGKTYTVSVGATATGIPAGPTSSASVQAGQTTPACDTCTPPNTPTSGDPIALVTGWYTYDNLDIAVPDAVVPLAFITTYNSAVPLPTDSPSAPDKPMGARWNHGYNTYIRKSGDGTKVYVFYGEGTTQTWLVPPSVTGWYTLDGRPTGDTLFVGSNLWYTLTRRDGAQLSFDPAGTLKTITAPTGNQCTLEYDGSSRLHRVVDAASGRALTLDYNGDGRVRTVSDGTGRQAVYTYDGADLKSVTVPGAPRARVFTYASPSLIESYVDESGNQWVYNRYDGQRRVTSQKDAAALASGESYGLTLSYATATENGVAVTRTTLTDRMGNVSVYTADASSRDLLKEEAQLGGGKVRRVTRVYDAAGNVSTETVYEGPQNGNVAGNTTTYTHDGAGNVTSVTDPLGNVSTTGYDTRNRPVRVTDIFGNATTLVYDGDVLTRITDALGRQRVFTYKPGPIQGLVETETDWEGNVTTHEYDSTGRRTKTIRPGGAYLVYGYDAHGFASSEETFDAANARVRLVMLTPDAAGRTLTRSTQYAGQPADRAFVETFTYDGMGQVKTARDALLRTTTFGYTAGELLQTLTFPAAQGTTADTEVTRYDREENVSGVQTGPVSVGYTWDALRRMLTSVDGNEKTTDFAYAMDLTGAAPHVSTATATLPALDDATRYTLSESYDAIGRLVAAANPLPGGVTTLAYAPVAGGPNGSKLLRITTTLPKTDPAQEAPFTRSETFDAAGRPVARTDERGKTWSTVYTTATQGGIVLSVATTTDPVGNQVIEATAPGGLLVERRVGKGARWRRARFHYDALGRITSTVEGTDAAPLTTTCAWVWDATSGGLSLTITPYGGAASVYLYDAAGEWVRYTDAAGVRVDLAYTPRGQLQSYTNGRRQALTYGYDTAGRYTSTTLPGTEPQVVSLLLDGNGNRKETRVAGTAVITRGFDVLNRMTSRTDPNAAVVGYTWTPLNRVDALTYPGSKVVQYAYDGLGRMTGLTDWAGRQASYGYYATGQLQSATLPNGAMQEWANDDAGRLTGFRAQTGNRVLGSAAFVLGPFGEPDTATILHPLQPVLAAGDDTFTCTSGRLAAINGQDVTYDDDGNATAIPGITGTLGYDIDGSLVSVGDATWTYDPDGLRVSATTGGATTRFVSDAALYVSPARERPDPAWALDGALRLPLPEGAWAALPAVGQPPEVQDPWAALDRLLAETDGSGGTLARYVYGVGLVGREDAGGAFTTSLFDHAGNAVALVGAGGAVAGRFAWDPFGRPAGQAGTQTAFGFGGMFGVADLGNGLVSMRARAYAPGALRFTAKDYVLGSPFQPQTLNRYAYALGNPIQNVDPLGLSSWSVWKIVGVAAGGVAGLGALVGGIVGGFMGAAGGGGLGGAIGGALGGAVGGAVAPVAALGGPSVAANVVRTGAQFGSRVGVRLHIRLLQALRSRRAGGVIYEAIEMHAM
ncbi:MAG: LamG-like jellyroll fold domain-containing protein [Longimicrobiaceae bacterium]